MTRKQIDLEIEIDTYIGNYEDVIAVSNVHSLLDRIYADIEEQTCSSCKYMKYGNVSMTDMAFCSAYDTLLDAWQDIVELSRFSCNKWAKQDD